MKYKIWICTLRYFLVIFILLSFFLTCSAATKTDENTIDQNTFLFQQNMLQMQLSLQEISDYMGVALSTKPLYTAKNVSKENIYFQVARLYQKTSQLYFEVTATYPDITDKNINLKGENHTMQDNLDLIKKINERLIEIKKHLSIQNTNGKVQQPESATPENMLEMLMLLNQEVNQLVELQTQPGDVFKNIILASFYMDAILNHIPSEPVINRKIPFVANKKPYDVFLQLLLNINLLNKIGEICNIQLITLEPNESNIKISNINPNDVEDLSQLIIAEITELANTLNVSLKNIDSYYPEKKYPSNVYRRAKILQNQLEFMLGYVKENPSWVKKHSHEKK